jgi:glycosyltransferase involved in cell wall biosynthesis
MDSVVQLLTSPVQAWDALICTSSAVRVNVEKILQAQTEYLRERLGASEIVMPQLPIIPLGIHTDEFIFSNSARQEARAKIGANQDVLIILYAGRLSFHAKAHPLAMYQALEFAAGATGKEIILVECGWHANEYIEDSFKQAAALACPSVRVVTLDGREAENRAVAWACADIFCSLSDNIQETFGIVPIEAMAAGLPVIVSDWNGYKDTVRDGIDGYRIPTIGPKPGLGGDLTARHALGIDTYDMYCGYSSSMIAIHSQKLTQAFVNLFTSSELRHTMGAAGQKRAKQEYDWKTIIPRYEELWLSLATLREKAKSEKKKASKIWPARLDPTISFSHYPTTVLSSDTLLSLTCTTANEAMIQINEYKELSMVQYASLVIPTQIEIQNMLKAAEMSGGAPIKAGSIIAVVTESRRAFALRGLAWLTKLGVFHFS